MKATGVLKTRVDGEWQEVPEFHRLSLIHISEPTRPY